MKCRSCATCVHVFDNPIAVVSFVAEQCVKFQTLDEWCDANRVVAIARQQHREYEISKRVGQREDFGCPTTLRFPYSLTESPPF